MDLVLDVIHFIHTDMFNPCFYIFIKTKKKYLDHVDSKDQIQFDKSMALSVVNPILC